MSLKSGVKKILLQFRLRGVNYKNLSSNVYIGKYTIIKADAASPITLGNQLVINNYITLLADGNGFISFGSNVFIGDYSVIRATKASIEIGSHTMLAQGVKLISTNHYYKSKDMLIYEQDIDTEKKGIKIGEDCWLGVGAVVLPGVSIGNGVVVGANAVVTKNVPDYAVVVGIPAKIVSYRI